MLNRRIIPCLDIKDGRVVKGVNFSSIRDAGDPIELAKFYMNQGADELFLLDITATKEGRKTVIELVKRVASELSIPFTVGGGIASIEDAERLIEAGATKVSVNSAALKRAELLTELSNSIGPERVVLALDVKKSGERWLVYGRAGENATDIEALEWALEGVSRGAGEILLTSIGGDGSEQGFAIGLTAEIASLVKVPVIASGGAGTVEHFKELFTETEATGALAATVFHYGKISIPQLKEYLKH